MKQEKAKKATKTQDQAQSWLIGYLSGKGDWPRGQFEEDSQTENISRNSLCAAKNALGERLVVKNLLGWPRRSTWSLEGRQQTTNATGTTGDEWAR